MQSVILSAECSCGAIKKGMHFHNCHEILFILEGWVEIELNFHRYRAVKGDLVVFGRLEQHAVLNCSPDYKRYVVQISAQLPVEDFKTYQIFSILFNRPDPFRNILSFTGNADRIEKLLQLILVEKRSQDILKEEMLSLLMQEFLILVYRTFPEYMLPDMADDTQIIYRIQARLDHRYAEEITLQSLAEEYGVSVSLLSHKFKKITGKSVMDYLQCSRLETAKDYLLNSNLKIGEIVEACGFSDCSNFSRMFRQKTGYTPREFRQLHLDRSPGT